MVPLVRFITDHSHTRNPHEHHGNHAGNHCARHTAGWWTRTDLSSRRCRSRARRPASFSWPSKRPVSPTLQQAMRRGRYFSQPEFPFTPGYDLVGTVIRVGPGGDASLCGRRVAALTKTGAWTGHALVQARDAIPVPAGVSAEHAEAVTVNGVTAWQMLHRAARVERGQTILVFGANGGVGGLLIQLAHHAGVRVIGAASPRHHDALRRDGVEPVDYNAPDLAETVRALAPGWCGRRLRQCRWSHHHHGLEASGSRRRARCPTPSSGRSAADRISGSRS